MFAKKNKNYLAIKLIDTGNGFNFLDPSKYSFMDDDPKSFLFFLLPLFSLREITSVTDGLFFLQGEQRFLY